ncbi:MAG TPA: fused MFS/spermidine synthase [Desulfobulbales bacterium]|nr:fused MFS/spermidine synthase [Desulfobulbales bacterium]
MTSRTVHANRAGLTILILLLYFLSGATGLSFEVLWFKDLRLLFGSTAYASSTVVAVFFLGISAGSFFWGRILPRYSSPIMVYGWLELGVALFSLPYLALLKTYLFIYPTILSLTGDNFFIATIIKFLLAALLLFPSTFLMGGTFPAISQFLVREHHEIGVKSSLIYAINTTGAVLGAALTGIAIPFWLGYHTTYFLVIGLTSLVGITAMISGVKAETPIQETTLQKKKSPGGPAVLLLFLAFWSGFLALCFEILWTRYFAQYMQNSVYTFSAILTTYLLALATGAFIAHALQKKQQLSEQTIFNQLIAAGLLNLAALLFFPMILEAPGALDAGSWVGFYGKTYLLTACFIFVPGVMTGIIFPSLLHFSGKLFNLPATAIGSLYSINIIGSIIGSLAAGFLMIQLFGVSKSLLLLSFLYLLTALSLMKFFHLPQRGKNFLLLLVALLLSSGATLYLDSYHTPHGTTRLLDTIEGSHATVTVVNEEGNIRMKVNSSYTIGDTFDLVRQRIEAEIPLYLHPNPQKVFFLGLGTGITAGSSLAFPIQSLTVCELLPEVIEASRTHYEPYLNGLFSDPRTKVIAEDGRSYLQAIREQYDIIIGDLFLPWKAGTGSLYTLEHFKNVKKRLRPEGLYFQWLPLYQMSTEEFRIIANTFLQVFPKASLWFATFYPHRPTLALVGGAENFELNPGNLISNWKKNSNNPGVLDDSTIESLILMYYAGNLGESADILQNAPINTIDFSIIEFLSPLTNQKGQSDETVWMKNEKAVSFLKLLWQQTPPSMDPYLTLLNERQKNYVSAGHQRFLYSHYRNEKLAEKADASLQEFKQKADEALVKLLFPDT